MTRQRHLPDAFLWRGDRYAFHRIQDGMTLARLDPYYSGEQKWPLLSGRTISPTGPEVRDITSQVHGMDLPATPLSGEWDEARVSALESAIHGDAVPERAAAAEPEAPPAEPVDLTPILSRLEAAEAVQLAHDTRITALEQSVEHLREFLTSVADSLTARLDALEAAPEPEPEPDLEVEPVEEPEPVEPDPLDGIPQSLRAFVAVDDTPQKFTLRMRRRYQTLKHMQMDATRPTNLRSFPDMTEEEVGELNMLEALGHETVNWLGAQA